VSTRLKEWIALLLWSILLFAVCYRLDTRHNRFPFYYHPDEPGKGEQVMTGDWNFHHPMLLLTTTKIVVKLCAIPDDEQAVVEAGRRVSAGFIAASVVALSLLAFLWRGWFAAFTTGAVLTFHHQFYELAHYMKEDSALMMGVAFTCLAALAYSQTPSAWRAAIVGASCGLAISGKYIGVMMLAIALPSIWTQGAEKRLRHLAFFGGALLVIILAVNEPLFWHPGTFSHSLNREVGLVVQGQGDSTRRVPHALYWNVFLDNSTPLIWVYLLSFVVTCWQRRKQLLLVQRLIVIAPFAYTLALSFSPKENDRYFIPATGLFVLLACLEAQDTPRLVCRAFEVIGLKRPERLMIGRWRWEAMLAGAFGLLTFQFTGWSGSKPGWLIYDAAFQRDDMNEAIAWMRADLPANAVVAADARTGLPDPDRKKDVGRTSSVPQKVMVRRYASDLGTLDELRAMGVTHVAVSESSYGRFFRPDLRAKGEQQDKKFRAARAFYEELLHGVPIFDRERGTIIYLHPGIRVYSIAEAKPS